MSDKPRISFNLYPRWMYALPLEEFLAPLRQAGLTAIEFELDANQQDWLATHPLISECASLGLELCFHAPFRPPYTLAGFRGAGLDAIRKAYSAMFAFASARAIHNPSSTHVVIHGAHGNGIPPVDLYKDTVDFLTWAVNTFPALTFTLENLSPPLNGEVKIGQSREEVLAILSQIGHPRLKACWDFGHDTLNNRLDPPSPEWLEQVVHVHAHNVHPDGRDHYPLDEGCVPHREWLAALAGSGFHGIITLEIKGQQLAGWEFDRVHRVLTSSIRSIAEEINP